MMRQKFNNPNMPFYHVQLAGWDHPKIKWAKFRLAQEATLKIPNTGMVTAMDLDGQPIQLLRYAYANYPNCPLYNTAGLPALSFEQPVL